MVITRCASPLACKYDTRPSVRLPPEWDDTRFNAQSWERWEPSLDCPGLPLTSPQPFPAQPGCACDLGHHPLLISVGALRLCFVLTASLTTTNQNLMSKPRASNADALPHVQVCLCHCLMTQVFLDDWERGVGLLMHTTAMCIVGTEPRMPRVSGSRALLSWRHLHCHFHFGAISHTPPLSSSSRPHTTHPKSQQ